ncbi:MAG: phage tail length tape measure family protein [Burkholderiales bacterium]|nr:phage tail length tape measure family protein [Burkholderiales bacterium]
MAKSAETFVKALEREASQAGKTRVELLQMRAAQLGVADAAKTYIDRIAQASTTRTAPAGLAQVQALTAGIGKSAALSVQQLQTLKFTVSDIVASAASGASPLTILLQQGGQVAQIQGGVSGLARGIVAALTPARLAFGATAAAAAGLAYAVFGGRAESKALADSLVVTGNYAGVTEGRFNALAKAVAASGEISIGTAREFAQALVSTGEIGPKSFEKAAEAAARYGAATGKSAKDVAAEFSALNRDVSGGASKLNQSLNFLTTAQLQQIRRLQEQGQAADALGIVYDALNTRFKALEPNLGSLDRALRAVSTTWSSFWDAAFDVGRTATIEDKISDARKALAAAQALRDEGPSTGPYRGRTTPDPARAEAAAEAVRLLNRSQAAQEATATAAAAQADLNKKGAAADEFVSGYLKRAKSVSALNDELAKAQRQFETLAKAGSPVSSADQTAVLAKIRADFKPAPTASSGAYDSLVRSITAATTAAEAERAGTDKLAESQRFAIAVVTQLAAAEGKYTVQQKQTVTAALASYLVIAQGLELRTKQIAAADELRRSEAEASQALDREASARLGSNQALRDALVEYGRTGAQIERLRITRLEDALATEEQALAVGRTRDLSDAEAAGLERNIKLLREQIALRTEGAAVSDAQRTDPFAGARSGLSEYIESVREAGTVTRQATGSALSILENDMTSSLASGTANYRAFTDFIVSETYRLLLVRPLLASLSKQLEDLSKQSSDSNFTSLLKLFGSGSGYTIDYGGSTTNLTGASLPTAGGAATGTNFVERDMLTILHKGEAVTPAAFNPYAPSAIAAAQARPTKAEPSSSGGRAAGGNMIVTVENHTGGTVKEERSRQGNDTIVKLIIAQAVAEVDRRISSGAGSTSAALISRGVNLSGAIPRRA